MIISISGKKLHGKDSIAFILCKHYNFKQISLADPLKHILASGLLDTFELENFYDQNIKDLPFSDYKDYSTIKLNEFQIARLIAKFNWYYPLTEHQAYIITDWFRAREFVSLRNIMQKFGSDLVRDHIGVNTWIDIAKRTIDPNENLVCSDARFFQEREMFKSLGAKLILVKRNLPSSGDSHISENQLGEDSDYDHVIYNFYDLPGLEILVRNWYENILKK